MAVTPTTGTRRPGLRAQIVVLVVATLVAGVGAAIWSRTVASGDDPVAEEDTIRLSDPGEVYVAPEFVNAEHDGHPFPEVTVGTVDGERVRLEAGGRPMVLNVWNTTCGPCSRELRYFGEVARELDGQVRFVGVDPVDSAERMTEFAAARGVDYELFLDDRFELHEALDVVAFPLTLFVAADGTIVAQAGELSESELREHVAALLA